VSKVTPRNVIDPEEAVNKLVAEASVSGMERPITGKFGPWIGAGAHKHHSSKLSGMHESTPQPKKSSAGELTAILYAAVCGKRNPGR